MPDQPGRESVRLVVDLDLTADGPSGHLVDENRSVCGFFGWLQLMDQLDSARQRATAGERERAGGGGGRTEEVR
jgi:hypothetical protein